jgi:hydroxyacyl-ACP dehydratase HTD2-like protein with hotdog domain
MSYDQYLGKSEIVQDTLRPELLRAMAGILGAAEPVNGELPPLWHWAMFQNWAPASDLRADGGVKAEGFLPPFSDMPRRMAAGGRVTFEAPIRAGDMVDRTSKIAKIQEKEGKAGKLVFLTIERTLSTARGVAIREENDVVYMRDEAKTTAAAAAAVTPPLRDGGTTRQQVGDALMLFRYSALTANSHRIHYDLEHATKVEGFPGLVVHGPLQASWLTALASELCPNRRMKFASFRHMRPVFHTDQIFSTGWIEDSSVALELRNQHGDICMKAEARMA